MPRPRFEKLAQDKRDHILEIAAREFAKHGYENASMNQILSEAGVSKGAAYYYFDDKGDLFSTAVERYYVQLDINIDELLTQATINNFWETFGQLYQKPFMQTYDNPWKFGVLKAASKLPPNSPEMERLTPIFEETFGWIAQILQKGQEIGAIRSDLDDEFMIAMLTAIDEASDNYLLAHIDDMTEKQVIDTLNQVVDMIRRMLSWGNSPMIGGL